MDGGNGSAAAAAEDGVVDEGEQEGCGGGGGGGDDDADVDLAGRGGEVCAVGWRREEDPTVERHLEVVSKRERVETENGVGF